MRPIKLLLILVIGMVLLGACASPPAVPPPTPAPQETPAPTPSPTLTPAPTTTPTPSPTVTGPYNGPLFDTHLHLAHLYSGELSRLRSAADLLSYLDRNKVEGAIGFYYFTKDKSMSFVSAAEAIIRGTRSRVIPLLQPEGVGWTQFASGYYDETVLRQYLQPQGLLQGVGEIALYWAPLQSVTFDSPLMQTVFQVVNELKGIVMIHPSNIRRGRPTELAEVEPSIRKYPDAIFLFHGNSEVFNLVAQLMSKYPNVYFTMDATCWYTSLMADSLLYPEGGDNPGHGNAESFLADVNRIGSDRLVEVGLQRVTPRLQQYPDRILWGTDLNDSWHFEEPVTDMVIKISRQLIGRLPADIQEKYAYQNAQRVFGRFLTPNP